MTLLKWKLEDVQHLPKSFYLLKVKTKVFKISIGIHDLDPLLHHWHHLLPLLFIQLQPQWPCSPSDRNYTFFLGPLLGSFLYLECSFSDMSLLIFFRSVVKAANGLPRSILLPFLGFTHWCTSIRLLSLTSKAALCHHVTKFWPSKIKHLDFPLRWAMPFLGPPIIPCL